MSELSGKIWVNRFPTKRTVNALNPPFRENAQLFIDALASAGVLIKINATLRPPERAFLMHFSFKIAMKQINAALVPPTPGVDIIWVHSNDAASIAAAKEMVDGYAIVKEPSLTSNHISGFAIDMTLKSFIAKDVKKADGTFLKISAFQDLITVGESYKVFHKVPNDPPHWSIDGH